MLSVFSNQQLPGRRFWRPGRGRGLQAGALRGRRQEGVRGELREEEPTGRHSEPDEEDSVCSW